MRLVPPARPIRRLFLPVNVVVLVVLFVACSIIAVGGVLAAPLSSRRRVLRLAAFAASYCAVELAALAAAGLLVVRRGLPGPLHIGPGPEWDSAHWRLLAWALEAVLGSARISLGFEVDVTETSGATALTERRPLLVLARHGGPGDSFALVHLLLTRYHRGVRVVLKDMLQLDPLLDVLLNRLGCCFVPGHAGDGADVTERLADVTRHLGPGDALLLFPEGGNWTPDRRTRAIRRLHRDHKFEAARVAGLMSNVLPPRPGGVMTCLEARPDLGVVVVAHAGLDRFVSVRQVWDEIPLRTHMQVRCWPTSAVPQRAQDRLAWLTLEWAVVDEWIEGFHTGVHT